MADTGVGVAPEDLARIEAALVAEAAEVERARGVGQQWRIGEDHAVGPAIGRGGAPGTDRPADGQRTTGHGDRIGCDLLHRYGARHALCRRADDRDGVRAVVARIDLVGIVRVDVGRQRIFEQRAVGIDPGRDVIGARNQPGGQCHLQLPVIASANVQYPAVVAQRGQQNVALPRMGTVAVSR